MMVFVLGFVAQLLFFTRTLVQWFLSERARRIISPNIFWVISIVASYLFFMYGWLRNDFSILLGQLISYYIYIWNLNQNKFWEKLHLIIRLILLFTPVVAIGFVLRNSGFFFQNFLNNVKIPLWLLILGSVGQVIFTLRFVYQWIYSMRIKQSVLPIGFWMISLIGSGIILVYGIIRLDPILILGQSFGFLAYTRNIILHRNAT